MNLKIWLFNLMIIFSSISSCVSVEDQPKDIAEYIGEKVIDDENKQLLSFSVPVFPTPIKEQQINTSDWTIFKASTPISGFYRSDDDQKVRSAFDFYRPVNEDIGKKKLPLVIFIHCGAFITGKKDDDLIISSLCRDFTRKGFATASINYRLLINTDNFITKTASLANALLSKESRNNILYHKSICDIRRATQYFHSHANEYGIDPDNVFLCGYSAGAIAALHAIYLDDNRASIWIHGMDGYNKSEMDTPKPNVRGVIAISGGFFRPPNELWEDNENTPLLLMQGDKDEMVPYGEGLPFQRYIKDYRLNSPVLAEIQKEESDNAGNEKHTSYTARVGLQVDKSWVDFLRSVFTDNMYGSDIIKNNKTANCTLVTVKDGLHYFPIDESTGQFNESYFTMREHALKFINQNIKPSNGL